MRSAVTSLLIISLVCLCVGIMGCGKLPVVTDQVWSTPTSFANSTAGLGGAFRIYKYPNGIFGVQVTKRAAVLAWWNSTSSSWSEVRGVEGLREYIWGLIAIDSQSSRVLLPDVYIEHEQLVMKAIVGNLTASGTLQNNKERKLSTTKESLLGTTNPNIRFNYHENGRQSVGLGSCMVNNSEAWIPFSIDAPLVTRLGNSVTIDQTKAVYVNGVFYSSDFGNVWQMEKVSDRIGLAPALCRTSDYVYFFSGDRPLWFCRKSNGSSSWENPQDITQDFARVNGIYDVVGEGDTAHICWMDRRHNKFRFNIDGPPLENNDIYYCRREDSAREWDKEVWLSKGLTYGYAPTISAEGNHVVVVWAGSQATGKHHSDMGPNDIYYVTSKDKGKTWTRPQKVTDVAKDGATCGMPQVLLLNGTIHLLYIQGTPQARTELTPGLTRLGQDSWPIYHTQRAFPQ